LSPALYVCISQVDSPNIGLETPTIRPFHENAAFDRPLCPVDADNPTESAVGAALESHEQALVIFDAPLERLRRSPATGALFS
jgi:hypothetical protein